MAATKIERPPSGAFKSRNFMTPELEAYYRLGDGYAELSQGEFADHNLWGVTYSPGAWDDRHPADGRSRCFHDRDSAIAYIEAGCPAKGD